MLGQKLIESRTIVADNVALPKDTEDLVVVVDEEDHFLLGAGQFVGQAFEEAQKAEAQLGQVIQQHVLPAAGDTEGLHPTVKLYY